MRAVFGNQVLRPAQALQHALVALDMLHFGLYMVRLILLGRAYPNPMEL